MSGVTTYKQSTADAICELIADGKSLREICLSKDMPSRATVFKWLGEQKIFSDQYARAREEQAETLADEIIGIADESQTTVREQDGFTEVTFDNVAVARNRLRVESRKWVASKLKPKKYGDRIQTEISGELNVGFHEILTKARERAGS